MSKEPGQLAMEAWCAHHGIRYERRGSAQCGPFNDAWAAVEAAIRADERRAAAAEIERLREALGTVCRAYVNLLEIGRDRIIAAGGTCDPVDVMEAADPALREARAALNPSPRSDAPDK